MFSVCNKSLLLPLVFAVAIQGVTFHCTFDAYEVIIVGDSYICEAEVNLGESGLTILGSVTGTHQPGKSDIDVNFLNINQQNLPFVPQGIANFFPSIKVLQIAYSRLSAVTAEDLSQFPELQLLSFPANNLKVIDGNLLWYTPNLQLLILFENNITNVGENFLAKSNELEYFDFRFNPCSQAYATTRSEVLELAENLPTMCPPLDSTTTIASETTTQGVSGECSCIDEITDLYNFNNKLYNLIAEQRQEFEERLAAIEARLQEV